MSEKKPIGVCLVRDKDGKPVLDHPLSAYPDNIRQAILAQMTEEEKKHYAA